MPQNELVDIREFLKFTSAGLKVASFVDIRASIIDRYKQAYGTDIDLSTGTADGVFVNDLALIVNNILQTVKTAYSNLDINTASGVYLDNLCSLANVYRKQQTASTASIEVTNTSTNEQTFGGLTFVDQAGTEWNYTADITFAAGETKTINVVCAVKGPVTAPAGWIVQTVAEQLLTVQQKTAAVVGQTTETDAELKARRAQSSGAAGVAVLESLVGALMSVSGIDDVKVYNNDSGATVQAKDGTSITANSIYVIVRKASSVTIDDSIIGSIIYEKMTPGIKTVTPKATIPKSYNYTPTLLGSRIESITDTCYWREVSGDSPLIKVVITPTSNFIKDAEETSILTSMIDYFNSLQLGTDITSTDALIQATYADPQSAGRATYIAVSATVNNGTSYTNRDDFYNYDISRSSITQQSDSANYVILLD